ncbi:MAG: nickel pincer cofactor biosynthesis protein LarC [Clostridiaceae bacterium]|nr:nickel pincer cofactor biosynthesis protein LarC [Clostridiaceae bacterium]
MKVLYLDCFSGISGDMMLGALLDLGIDQDKFRSELEKLKLPGFQINIDKKMISGIAVTDVEVVVHEHNHNHNHGNGHHHEDDHHHHHCARNINDIERLIDDSGLSVNVKDFSKRVFEEIAKAEARVHNMDIGQVHFHEVGAVDSIVDIVGVAICLDLLGADRVYCSALHDGNGFIECQHGKLPVPVPAVMEMLKKSGIPYITEDINTELVTPTGMGLVKCLSAGFGVMPPMTVDMVGYGAGKRETGRFNALRCVMGELLQGEGKDGEILVLETNIDDMNPEILGYVMERLFENGALDVFYSPVYMKKNRPGIMLTVLSEKDNEDNLTGIIMEETSTLGVRKFVSKRHILGREFKKVNTRYGEVRVKVAGEGAFGKAAPEYEDCVELAKKNGVPLRKIYDEVNRSLNS